MGVGTQAVTGSLTYQDASIFAWQMDRTQAQTRGIGYDAVNVTGALAGLDGADANTTTDAIFRIVIGDSAFNQPFWSTARTWTDIFSATTTTGSLQTIFSGGFQYSSIDGSAVSPAGQGSFALTGNTLVWTPQNGATFVPEPTSALAGLLLGAGLLRRRR